MGSTSVFLDVTQGRLFALLTSGYSFFFNDKCSAWVFKKWTKKQCMCPYAVTGYTFVVTRMGDV